MGGWSWPHRSASSSWKQTEADGAHRGLLGTDWKTSGSMAAWSVAWRTTRPLNRTNGCLFATTSIAGRSWAALLFHRNRRKKRQKDSLQPSVGISDTQKASSLRIWHKV